MKLTPPFQHIGGHCYTVALDAREFPDSDDETGPSRSAVILSEDGTDLGPPHTAHQLISAAGEGAYSHWRAVLYFSASDGGDPNTNERRYEVRRDTVKYFSNRAEHSASIVDSYLRRLPGGRGDLDEARILEIGPGREMGAVMLMAGLGGRAVAAVDRFVGAWREGWHEPFLDALKIVAANRYAIDLSDLAEQAKARRSFNVGPISFFAGAFEEFGRTGAEFDITLSHSVFEHFYSVASAADALFAVSAPMSRGAHHVDFRDHRNFGEPLEFLLTPADDYADPAVNSQYGRGNRVRHDEMTTLLKKSGFDRVDFTPDVLADPRYLAAVEKRLLAAGGGVGSYSSEALAVLSGDYFLRREGR